MRKYLMLAAALAAVTACSSSSGGGSGGVVPSSAVTISGKISDPAIEEARLTLISPSGETANFCGVNFNSVCQAWSAQDGTFSMTVSNSADLSGYHIKSTGGTDTAYGINYSGISLTSPADAFAAGADGNYSGVNVTPLTSLMKSLMDSGHTADEAAEVLASALGLNPADIQADPESSGEILKQAFLVVKAAMAIGGDDPIGKIAGAVAKNGGGFSSDAVLSEIFASDAASAAEMKAAAQAFASMSSENIAGLVESISSYELTNMFLKSYASLLGTEVSALSANAVSNIGFLAGSLKTFAGAVIPLNEFTVNQIARYIASYDASLGQYATFDTESAVFQANLGALFASAGEELKNILDKMISEDVYIASVPLSEPLGGDNQKRLEYYFNSDADRNYKARSLTARVLNDSVNDDIYLNIIRTYAKFNLIDKAETFADVYVRSSLNRAKAHVRISEGASLSDRNTGLEYAQKAYGELESIRNGGFTVDADFINIYVSVAGAFSQSGAADKFLEVNKLITGDLINAASKPQTVFGQLLSKMGAYTSSTSILKEYLDSGDIRALMNLLPVFTDSTGEYYNKYYDAGIKSTMNTVANSAVMYYSHAMMFYAEAAAADASYKEQAQAEALKIYDKILSVVAKEEAAGYPAGLASGLRTQLKYGAVGAYLLISPESGSALLDKMGSDASGKRTKGDVVADIMFSTAAGSSFDDAKNLYESISPVDETYSNVVGSKQLVYAFVGTASYKTGGMARQAIEAGNNDLARQALDYAYGKVKDAAAYQLTRPEPSGINFIFSDFTESQAKTDKMSTFSGYTGKYSRDGYTAVAYYYDKLGDKDKAREVLEAAKSFNDNLSDNFVKYLNCSALAYYAREFGFGDLYEKWYGESAGMSLIASAPEGHLFSLDVFRAYDAVVMERPDYAATARDLLAKAESRLVSMYESAASEDYYKTSVSRFRDIAGVYEAMFDYDGARAALVSAEKPLDLINSQSDRKEKALDIIEKYTALDFVDEAYEKTMSLLSNTADRHDGVRTIAEGLTSYKVDSSNGYIAVSDFDKDGKPDFFAPWATQADIDKFGYVLDDDIDGDGKPDTEDLTPFYKD